jgi:uncharacterized membrane protein
MEKFWNIFWKVFGISLLLAIVIGIIMGFVSRSNGIIYAVIQRTIAVGFGICGLIGLVVIPPLMFLEDRIKGGETEDAVD